MEPVHLGLPLNITGSFFQILKEYILFGMITQGKN
ncbi:hypothetical protein BvCmsNSP052_04856 [Escherichia coli]|nr:hypothetical protein BvCmsNSP052_04856 [Escherichia coli]GDQ57127.1 hypothetical protein BvCmsNSP072_04644 [Escherichia coli]